MERAPALNAGALISRGPWTLCGFYGARRSGHQHVPRTDPEEFSEDCCVLQ